MLDQRLVVFHCIPMYIWLMCMILHKDVMIPSNEKCFTKNLLVQSVVDQLEMNEHSTNSTFSDLKFLPRLVII
jgi:hypothetical protein